LKTPLIILLLQPAVSSIAFCQQYYLRGEVKDEKGVALQNVSILHHATGFMYRSGVQGAFGILTKNAADTLTFSMDGYHKETVVARAGEYLSLQLRLVPVATTIRRDKLASQTKDLTRDVQRKWFTGDETYASIVENRFVESKKYPTTGVALNIDKASYSNVRRFINMNTAVPPDAVRIEEMLNYFNFGYDAPAEGEIFKVKTTLTSCPWNEDNQLFFVNVSSQKKDLESLPPTHLVFLIDISGSMDMPNRLPLLKSAFHLLTNNLREKDTVSIVVYGGAVGIMLQPTCGREKEKINRVIDELEPGGSTPGESGIRIAYNLARFNFVEGGNNRVILATDGDFNVGIQTEKELDELITRHRESGIYLTCLGVGMGNYKDSKIQTLARKGNGNFYYIDNYQEAEKVLLKEFAQTLYTVADNVYLNIKFEPGLVEEYRLIGFDNKVGALADTLSEIEGGEIGSTHTMMAAFEIIPRQNMKNNYAVTPFAEIELLYRLPGDTTTQKKTHQCNYEFVAFNDLAPAFRFATAVIIYGSILRSSHFVKNAGWNDVLFIAGQSANKEDITQVQFVQLVEKTKQLYNKFKKRKREKEE